MAAPGNHKGNREKAAARRLQALEMRKGGASYGQIGKQLGVSDQQASNDVRRCLDRLGKLADDVAGHLRTMEEARLDALLLAVMPQARQGNLGAVDRVVRIMERRAKLLGLDAPTKIAPTDPTGETAQGWRPRDGRGAEAAEGRGDSGAGRIGEGGGDVGMGFHHGEMDERTGLDIALLTQM
jgi:hypothetical protein